MATRHAQSTLFPTADTESRRFLSLSSTFVPNMGLPVHRWFRYSAGFSAEWARSVIESLHGTARVFDPFAGSATTLLAAQASGAESWGLEAHPFVQRVARAKLLWRSAPDEYLRKLQDLKAKAKLLKPEVEDYPALIRKCYDDETLKQLDVLRRAYEQVRDDSPASELAWLTLIVRITRSRKPETEM
jgi:hypothetical protein